MKIEKIWFGDHRIYGQCDDGRVLWQSLSYYPKLLSASKSQRLNYELNAFGIRWEELNEDVSFESFEYDNPEPNNLSQILMSHPELNLSALARRLGIQQSLLATYVNGTRTPSPKRMQKIIQEIHKIGEELLQIKL